MKKILIICGDNRTSKKIAEMNFSEFNKANFEYIYPLNKNLNASQRRLDDGYSYLLNSHQTSLRTNIKFVYNLSKFFYASSSFRIHLCVMLFGNYRIFNKKGLILFISHILKINTLFYFCSAFLGFMRFPEKIFNRLLGFKFNDSKVFTNLLENSSADFIVFITSGRDNFHFLFNSSRKNPKTTYIMIIANWDGPSSKNIISKNFDHVGVWNSQQVSHVEKFGLLNKKISVVGSPAGDSAHNMYRKPFTARINNSSSKSLLYIGQRNNFDEISDVIRIQQYLNLNHTVYSKVVYRPHPLSTMKAKRIEINKIALNEIEVNTAKILNLREFDGIICLPTTLLLEVLLTQISAVVYIPKDNFNRRDPNSMWSYKHFDQIRKLAPIKVVKDFQELLLLISIGLPSPKPLSDELMDSLFPRFDITFKHRIDMLVKKVANDF